MPPQPFHFYFLVWSKLLPDRANSVMILKTCEALARLAPDWIIELRYLSLPVQGVEPALRTLGVQPPPNLRISTLFPSRARVTDGQVSRVVSGSGSPRVVRQRAAWTAYWRKELAAAGQAVLYTRNPPLLPFFQSLEGLASRPPLILELHQLKHGSRAGDYLAAGEPGGLPISLTRAKEVLRRFRDEEARSLGAADLIFCISGPLAERMRAMHVASPTRILRSAVSERLLEIGQEAGAGLPPERDLDLLYTGQLYYWKGVHTVIEALRYCREDVRLTVVGGNDPADLHYARRLAENLGVASRIDWVGQVPHGEVLGYQRRAKIGVVPLPRGHRISRWYTSPIKVFEMMAAGLPLLASDLPSLRDFLEPDVTAAFAPPDDPRAWGRAIDELMASPGRRDQLAATARRRIAEFSFESRARQIVEAVEELRSGRPSSPASPISARTAAR